VCAHKRAVWGGAPRRGADDRRGAGLFVLGDSLLGGKIRAIVRSLIESLEKKTCRL